MTKVASGVRPFIDVEVPLPREDLSQAELVRSVVFLIRFVPGRPKHKRQRTVTPNDIEIVHRKILLSPIAGRRDDGLMFADHLLEIFDHLQGHVVLGVAKIHECPGVSAVLGDGYLNRTIPIDACSSRGLLACCDEQRYAERTAQKE